MAVTLHQMKAISMLSAVVTHLLLSSWCSPGGKGRVTGSNFMWLIELNYFSLETGFLVIYMIIFVSFLVVSKPDTG